MKDQTVEQKFNCLLRAYRNFADTIPQKYVSNIGLFTGSVQCLKIIRLGKTNKIEVTTLILESWKLKHEVIWNDVLRNIWNIDPIPEEHAGEIDLIREDWFVYLNKILREVFGVLLDRISLP